MNRTAPHDSLVKACIDLLWLHGIGAWEINKVAHRLRDGSYRNLGAPAGFPDIVAAVPPLGHMLTIECKSGAAKPNERQREILRELEDRGVTCAIIHTVDELVPIIRSLKRSGLRAR